MSRFMDMVRKGAEQVRKNPRTCEICGKVETIDNVMLKYHDPVLMQDLIMCDDCMITRFYAIDDAEEAFI